MSLLGCCWLRRLRGRPWGWQSGGWRGILCFGFCRWSRRLDWVSWQGWRGRRHCSAGWRDRRESAFSVEGFFARQSFDDGLDALGAGFGLACLQAVGYGVEVGFVEGLEEGLGLLVLRERPQEVGGDGGVPGGSVGGFPAAIGFGGVYLFQPGGGHLARLDEALDVLGVVPGPAAAGAARGEFLQPGVFVVGVLLAVDPAEAQGLIEGLGVGEAGDG